MGYSGLGGYLVRFEKNYGFVCSAFNLGLMNSILAVFYAWTDYLEQLSFLCKDYRSHWLQIHQPYFHCSKVQSGLQKTAVVSIISNV